MSHGGWEGDGPAAPVRTAPRAVCRFTTTGRARTRTAPRAAWGRPAAHARRGTDPPGDQVLEPREVPPVMCRACIRFAGNFAVAPACTTGERRKRLRRARSRTRVASRSPAWRTR